MGWGGFLDKLLDKLPIQGRVERWKNEVEDLELRQRFIKIHKHNYLADEYESNEHKLRKLRKLLKNKAN